MGPARENPIPNPLAALSLHNRLYISLQTFFQARFSGPSCRIASMDHRKTKEELDQAIPFHTLLDVSASKSKALLAHKGTLGQRHRPSADALRASVMRRSVSTASNFSSSYHTVSYLWAKKKL